MKLQLQGQSEVSCHGQQKETCKSIFGDETTCQRIDGQNFRKLTVPKNGPLLMSHGIRIDTFALKTYI